MTVWDSLMGQQQAVATLTRAIEGSSHAMSHAWLITGPPGSGRSVAARAFSAGLQCADGGCGSCKTCSLVLAGTHPDLCVVRTEKLSIGVDEVRDLVKRSAMSPTLGRWQTLIVEDADRITERGADALLKAIEEPAAKTVWILCAPTADDMIATVRSRCREVNLVTPSVSSVADLLQGEGVGRTQAMFAARVCQGHIGRARAIATDPAVAARRKQILSIPAALVDLGSCLERASWAVTTAQDEAAAATAQVDAEEKRQLATALGLDSGRAQRGATGMVKDLEEQQGLRAKRLVRDQLDTVLLELTSYYRDVLMVQTGAGVDLINADCEKPITGLARTTTGEETVHCLDAIAHCRQALATNVTPLLAFEALMVTLARDSAR